MRRELARLPELERRAPPHESDLLANPHRLRQRLRQTDPPFAVEGKKLRAAENRRLDQFENLRGEIERLDALAQLLQMGGGAGVQRIMMQGAENHDAAGLDTQRGTERGGNRNPPFLVKPIDKAR